MYFMPESLQNEKGAWPSHSDLLPIHDVRLSILRRRQLFCLFLSIHFIGKKAWTTARCPRHQPGPPSICTDPQQNKAYHIWPNPTSTTRPTSSSTTRPPWHPNSNHLDHLHLWGGPCKPLQWRHHHHEEVCCSLFIHGWSSRTPPPTHRPILCSPVVIIHQPGQLSLTTSTMLLHFPRRRGCRQQWRQWWGHRLWSWHRKLERVHHVGNRF